VLDGCYKLPPEASDTLKYDRDYHAARKEALK
jgi:hypothetical protein